MRDDGAVRLLERLPPDERHASWHLVSRDGRLAGRGVGGAELLGAMRLTRPAARLIALAPDRLVDAVYAFVARYRKPLGRLVPDGPVVRRYP